METPRCSFIFSETSARFLTASPEHVGPPAQLDSSGSIVEDFAMLMRARHGAAPTVVHQGP